MARTDSHGTSGQPEMRHSRFTIANLMAAVVVAAIMLAVFRFGSFTGLVALVPMGVTAIIARFGSSRAEKRLAFWLGAAGTLALPFVVAIWMNYAIWGYYLARPAVDPRIVEARQIETVTQVETISDPSGSRAFAGGPVGEVDSFIQVHPQEGDYYVLEGRVLRALKDRQALPSEARGMPASRLQSLYKVVDETGRIEEGEPGYWGAKNLRGLVVEALGRDGSRLVFVGVWGGEVSNDHHPYYEFLFTTDSPDGQLRLLSTQRFYYDVAGIEGIEWPVFFSVLAIASLIPTLVVQGVLLRRGRRRLRRLEDTTRKTSIIKPDPPEREP
jgi:hypothetical protein